MDCLASLCGGEVRRAEIRAKKRAALAKHEAEKRATLYKLDIEREKNATMRDIMTRVHEKASGAGADQFWTEEALAREFHTLMAAHLTREIDALNAEYESKLECNDGRYAASILRATEAARKYLFDGDGVRLTGVDAATVRRVENECKPMLARMVELESLRGQMQYKQFLLDTEQDNLAVEGPAGLTQNEVMRGITLHTFNRTLDDFDRQLDDDEDTTEDLHEHRIQTQQLKQRRQELRQSSAQMLPTGSDMFAQFLESLEKGGGGGVTKQARTLASVPVGDGIDDVEIRLAASLPPVPRGSSSSSDDAVRTTAAASSSSSSSITGKSGARTEEVSTSTSSSAASHNHNHNPNINTRLLARDDNNMSELLDL
jgi:hypothetical protein